jgi:hypothetical protein
MRKRKRVVGNKNLDATTLSATPAGKKFFLSLEESRLAKNSTHGGLPWHVLLMRFWNYLACRLWQPRDYWHNRHFDGRYRAEASPRGAWSVSWRGEPVVTHSLEELAGEPHPPVCHIIASGPSLASVRSPGRLFDGFTVCLNGSFRFAQQAGKVADLYLTNDGGFIRRRWADFRNGAIGSRRVLLDHLMLFFLLRQDASLARQLSLFLYDDPNRPYLARSEERAAALAREYAAGKDFIQGRRAGTVRISRHPGVGIARSSSVVCSALQMAWLMKFREVRIYGMDLGGDERFYAEGSRPEPSRLDRDYEEELLPWFREFAAHCCGPEFRVLNCAPNSRLPDEVFPRVDPNAP